MLDETKDVIDVAAASTALLTLAAWLPPTASILTIVWMVLRIYGSLDVWICECMDLWKYGSVDVWIFQCMDLRI